MKTLSIFIIFVILFVLAIFGPAASAAPISISIAPAAQNPASPKMGDHLTFHTIIRNDGSDPVDGLIAWLSLVQVDRGHEQPIDLEDWSAHKAVTAAKLAPGQTLETDWPMRLISGRPLPGFCRRRKPKWHRADDQPFRRLHRAPEAGG